MENPLQYFAELSDPRVEGRSDHLLEEILLITIAAVLSGADSWNEIEDYGKAKQDWLSSFLRLPGGIPSHDTFNRVFSLQDPAELETCFLGWVSSIAQRTAGEVVAIDGKSLRGTREGGKKTLVHMVSAWANSNNLVLGQQKVDEKSNEIAAIPKLLKALELSGTIVTIDAIGWGIENKLHWVLDVAFREDASRKRAGNAAQNFSRITRIALNLLKQNKTSKLGMKGKRLKAGWDNNYLLQLLGVVV